MSSNQLRTYNGKNKYQNKVLIKRIISIILLFGLLGLTGKFLYSYYYNSPKDNMEIIKTLNVLFNKENYKSAPYDSRFPDKLKSALQVRNTDKLINKYPFKYRVHKISNNENSNMNYELIILANNNKTGEAKKLQELALFLNTDIQNQEILKQKTLNSECSNKNNCFISIILTSEPISSYLPDQLDFTPYDYFDSNKENYIELN